MAAPAVPVLTPDPAALARLGTYLQGLAALLPVTVLAPRIEPHVPPNLVLQQGCTATYSLRPGLAEAFGRLDIALQQAIAPTGATYLPLAALGLDMAQDFMSCQALYWSDGDHWSPAGEARFGPRLLGILPDFR
jgi:hypothetical protein